VKWPGKIEPGTTSDQLISGIDMLATLAAATDQKLEPKQQADSMNVLEAFTGSPAEDIRDSLVLIPRSSKHVSIRKGKWMYIPNQSSGGFNQAPGNHGAGGPKAISYIGSKNSDIENGKVKSDAPKAQLYDLEADVNQTTNIHDKHPEVVKEMQALLTTKFKTRKKKK